MWLSHENAGTIGKWKIIMEASMKIIRSIFYRGILFVGLTGMALMAQADHYVAQNGQIPSGNYESWETAASNIQAAINVAGSGATVWVGTGTYAIAGSGGYVAFINNKSLTLRGAGVNPGDVVIDGGNANRGIYARFVTNDLSVEIDGFTITNCNANYGAGIWLAHETIMSGTAIVRNCTLVNNTATTTGTDGGGAVRSYAAVGSTFYTLVSNCVVVGNTSASRAGGLNLPRGRVELVDCIISNNTAVCGAGIWAYYTDIIMRHGAVANNTSSGTADLGGAGVFFHDGCNVVIDDCLFKGNSGAGFGGGVLFRGAGIFCMTNCVVVDNTAHDGGGIHIRQAAPTQARFVNNLIAGNKATTSGGGFISTVHGQYDFVNCTIVDNVSTQGLGAGIYFTSGTASKDIRNSIVYSNVCSNVVANYRFVAGAGTSKFYNSCTTPSVAGGDYDGGSNTDADPLLVDWVAGDYRLASGSPCINTGANQDWMSGALDVGGRSRLDRLTRLVDMGCHEYIFRGSMMHIR